MVAVVAGILLAYNVTSYCRTFSRRLSSLASFLRGGWIRHGSRGGSGKRSMAPPCRPMDLPAVESMIEPPGGALAAAHRHEGIVVDGETAGSIRLLVTNEMQLAASCTIRSARRSSALLDLHCLEALASPISPHLEQCPRDHRLQRPRALHIPPPPC